LSESPLTPRAPFQGLPFPSAGGRGVLASDRDGLGIATVLARRGPLGPLAARVREQFGIELPSGPQRVTAGDVAFAGIGPESWLVTSEIDSHGFAASVKEALSAVAAVADQSSGYAVLRLTGPKVRDALAKMLPIDLHARNFRVGAVAATIAAHVGTTLWRLEDANDGSPVFEIAIYRSFAGSFWHGLAESAAEFGFVPGAHF
jgi:heterotetrameric sarcosine oxidase gamma subunit